MQPITITINRDTVSLAADEAPALYVGNLVLFKATIVDAAGAAVVFGETDEFFASLDTDYGPDHDDLATAADDQFNIDGDWASADPTAGLISFRLSTDTAAMVTAMSTTRRKPIHLELWTREAEGTWILLLHQTIVIYNITADFD